MTDEKLNNFIEVLQEVISSVAIFKAMESIYDNINRPLIFNNIMNYSAMIATIRISNFMGSEKEENHWKNIFDISRHDEIRKDIFLKVFKTQSEYRKYHENLIKFRNNYVTHYNLSGELGVVTHFSDAIEVVFLFLDFIKNIYIKDKGFIVYKRISHQLGKRFYDKCFKQTLKLIQ